MNRKSFEPTSPRQRLIAVIAAAAMSVVLFDMVAGLGDTPQSATLVENVAPTHVAKVESETSNR